MEELELRKQIIEACKVLQEKKLVARTWGNVSARLNDKEFIITPSGLDYSLTTVDDLVKVQIADCSYDKAHRKPSSEKRIHASAYKLRSDVNFIIHTHQLFASAICAEESSIYLSDNTFVPCIEYGLPGTKGLANNVEKIYKRFDNTNIFLMAKHGTICFGKDNEEAINNALKLEDECKALFSKRVKEIKTPETIKVYLDDYAQMFPPMENEDEEALKLVKEKNIAANLYVRDAKPLSSFDVKLQHFVYRQKYSKLKDK